jgi:hypothetical protein
VWARARHAGGLGRVAVPRVQRGQQRRRTQAVLGALLAARDVHVVHPVHARAADSGTHTHSVRAVVFAGWRLELSG